jgi:hypothetical protein
MSDQHFLSSAARADIFGPLHGGERAMWRGRCGVAEYAFEEAASLPRWTLPESTDVLVTDQRVLYAYTAADGHQVRSGELRWLWPQHLRVQPGQVSRDRGAAATQIQLVCGGTDGTYPALVFAGGDLATVADADRVANVIRQAIARFRLDNAAKLGLSTSQARMLSRLLIGPEFRNHQGGEGETVSLLGAMPVSRPAPAPAMPPSIPLEAVVLLAGEAATVEHGRPEPVRIGAHAATEEVPLSAVLPATPARPVGEEITRLRIRDEPTWPAFREAPARTVDDEQTWMLDEPSRQIDEGTRLIYRPGMAADAARALLAAKAEEAAQQAEPALASRAADLAARVADLVAGSAGPEPSQDHVQTWDFTPAAWRPPARSRHAEPRVPDDLRITPSAQATDAERLEVPTSNLTERAQAVRRTAARMAANAARVRTGGRRADRETGFSTRGNHGN